MDRKVFEKGLSGYRAYSIMPNEMDQIARVNLLQTHFVSFISKVLQLQLQV